MKRFRARPRLALCCAALLGVFSLVTMTGLTGCASTATHPGAVSTFDSQAYDSLVSIQASIEQAKADFGSDPAAKAPLNRVIAAYNAAQDAYKSYHALAVSGKAPDPTSLQAQISALVADIASIRATFGKQKGGAA
jgi:hypothetical protein